MNKTKIFALVAVLIATVSAFAGQKKSSLGQHYGYYKPVSGPCTFGLIDDFEECAPNETGPLCTIDGYPASYDPAGCSVYNAPYLLYQIYY